MILCDNCRADVTPNEDDEISERNIINLNGEKVCLCTDCFIVLRDFIKSEEFKKKAYKYKNQFEIED